MKRFLLAMALLVVSAAMFAETTEETSVQKKEKREPVVDVKNFSHWSIAIGGGMDMLIAERVNKGMDTYYNYKDNFLGGCEFQLEYMLNPRWGFMLQYQYLPVSKNSFEPSYNIDKQMDVHEVTLQANINVLNLMRRKRVWTDWNLFFQIGGGAAFYSGRPTVLDLEIPEEEKDFTTDINKFTFCLPFGLSLEYNPIDPLGIFMDAHVTWYSHDDINWTVGGRMNDMSLYVGLGLRWHLAAKKRPHCHTICMNDYEPLGGSNIDPDEIDKATKAAVKKAQDELKDEYDKKIKDLEDQLNKMNTTINNIDNSYVGDVNNTTVVNNYVINAEDHVYFEYGSAKVDADNQIKVAKAAKKMLQDPNLTIELVGSCDEAGSVEFNKVLSQKRVDTVYDLLVNKYHIDKSRITTNSLGKIEGANEISELNRCVKLNFPKEDEDKK